MKVKCILAAFAIMASGSLFAQNATKADLDKLANQVNALSQKVTQLETNLERVITENVNLVEQLKVKTITSATDKNGVQWDIVKVEPDATTNDVVLSLRLTNNSGVTKYVGLGLTIGSAVDSDSNRSNNVYKIVASNENPDISKLAAGVPVNIKAIIKSVPSTSSYMAVVKFSYGIGSNEAVVNFTGVHIPW